MSFFPYDRDILTSSLWANGTPEAFKVWSYLLLTADLRTGRVEDADPAIALRCGLPLETTVAVLEWLTAPDPYSRTKDHDGRRIERLPDGGFQVLNFLRRQAKDYSTPRVRSWRERKRSETVKRVSPLQGTTDTDTDTDTDKRTTDPPPTPSASGGEAAAGGATGNGSSHETRPSRTRRTSKPGATAEAAAVAARFVLAFNATFGRRVTALPALVADVAARLAAGYSADQLVAVPILVDAHGLPADLRAGLQPRWLLRVGDHPRAGADGRVNGGKDWIGAALDGADRTRLWPRHVEAAEAVGVLETLKQLGARLADGDAETIA